MNIEQLIHQELQGIVLDKQTIQNLYDDPTILSLVSSPSTFKKEMIQKDILIQTYQSSVEEAHNYTKVVYKLNYPLTPFKQEFSTLLKYIYYFSAQNEGVSKRETEGVQQKEVEKPSKKLVNYWTNNTDFFQKSYIRIKLLKCAWNPIKIEELIRRHFPNTSVIPSEKQIQVRYLLLKGYLRLPTITNTRKTTGRPKCPPEVKEIVQLRINKKLAENVKKNRDTLSQIMSLFTFSELDELVKCVPEELAEKCVQLKEILLGG